MTNDTLFSRGDVFVLDTGEHLIIDFINGPITGATFYESVSSTGWSHPLSVQQFLAFHRAEKIGTVKLKAGGTRADSVMAVARLLAKRKAR